MSVFESKARLTKALRELQSQWYATRADWNDNVATQFEKRYLINLEVDMRNATGAMDEMAVLLQQIRRDCQ